MRNEILANVIGFILCFVILSVVDFLFGDDINIWLNLVIAAIIVAAQFVIGRKKKR